jgi:hypothetical protein
LKKQGVAKMESLKKLKKHSLNIFALIVGLLVFGVGFWQIDLISAPLLWEHKFLLDLPFPLPDLYNTTAYVMFSYWVFIGLAVIILSLWFWE